MTWASAQSTHYVSPRDQPLAVSLGDEGLSHLAASPILVVYSVFGFDCFKTRDLSVVTQAGLELAAILQPQLSQCHAAFKEIQQGPGTC